MRARVVYTPSPWVTASSYLLIIALYGWVFVSYYAKHGVQDVLDGHAPLVHVQMSSDPGGIPALEHDAAWTYLGAVSNYVFVYDRTSKRALILPVNNIVRIEPVPDQHAENAAAKTAAKPN